jgi:type IV pilus assembly protein PilA
MYGYPAQRGAPGFPAPPAKKGMGTGLIILIVVLALVVPTIGVLATLGIYGTRKYIANAKTAEARNVLGQLSKAAVITYEEAGVGGEPHMCPSASAPVPADRSKVSGMKYMSSRAEWLADEETHAGFACLGFEMTFPQYFQYEYESTSTGFVARAHGDLDGDGIFSTYEISGELVGGHLVVSPTIRETNPGE